MSKHNRSNSDWIHDLETSGQVQEDALEDLRKIIQRGLPYAVNKYLTPTNPNFEELIDEVTQLTLLRVLDKLDTFEGRSKFTTWVHKIAVRLALTELRRRKWKDVSLDELVEEQMDSSGLLADKNPGPDTSAERNDYMERIQRIISEELTDKQREAMMAIAIGGVPVDEVARRMNSSRNALYKLLHDARLSLKQRMLAEGLSPEEVLGAFQ